MYLCVVPGPYPPPPGAYNVSPVMKWSAGETGSAIYARRMRMPSSEGKVDHDIITH